MRAQDVLLDGADVVMPDFRDWFTEREERERNMFDYLTEARIVDARSGAPTINLTGYIQDALLEIEDGGTFRFPRADYLCTKGEYLAIWEAAQGIHLIADAGARFVYDSGIAWTPGENWANFFFGQGCTDIDIEGIWRFQGNLTTSDLARGTFDGNHGFLFRDGAKRVRIGTVYGKGIGQPVQFDRTPLLRASLVTLVAVPGTGYSVGNIVSPIGWTGGTAPTFRVTAVDGSGGITGVSVETKGSFTPVQAPTIANNADGITLASVGSPSTSAKINVQLEDADESLLNEDIVIDSIKADTCWYGLSFVYGCRNAVVRQLAVDNIYRATVLYGGIENLDINCTLRNHWGDCFTLGCGMGLGFRDVRANVHVLPQTAGMAVHGASKIRLSYVNNWPAVFSGLALNTVCNYGAETNRGGALLEIDKEDTKARGHVFSKLNWTGSVSGSPSEDTGLGGNIGGTNLSATWVSGDDMGDGFQVDVDLHDGGDIAFHSTFAPPVYRSYFPGSGLMRLGANVWRGDNTPEGQVTAPVGSTYQRRNGGASTSFYVKESGSGNTGWVAK